MTRPRPGVQLRAPTLHTCPNTLPLLTVKYAYHEVRIIGFEKISKINLQSWRQFHVMHGDPISAAATKHKKLPSSPSSFVSTVWKDFYTRKKVIFIIQSSHISGLSFWLP